MINIQIAQTRGGKPREFDVFFGQRPKFIAKLGDFSPIETFRMKSSNVVYSGSFAFPQLLNLPLIRLIAGRPKSFRNCFVKQNSHNFGNICGLSEKDGRYYLIDDLKGHKFTAYRYSIDGSESISIFSEQTKEQIGRVLTSFNLQYTGCAYSVYIDLPEGTPKEQEMIDLITMFVVYYNNWNHFDSVRLAKGGKPRPTEKNWYMDKYNDSWLEEHMSAAGG